MNNKTIAITILSILVVAGALYYFTDYKNTQEANTASSTATVVTENDNVPVNVVQHPTITVTQADNGKTVTVKKGTRVVVALGDDIWTLALDPIGIINRIKNIATIRGVQGIYTADVTGSTKLSGEGRPNCASGSPCSQAIVSFSTTIVVTQ